jgi:uncharacterized membrane protein
VTEGREAAWWIGLAGTALALAGLGLSAYLTAAHYTTAATLACPEHGTIDCAKVTTSSYAVQHGVPLAVLGLVFFAVSLALHVPPLWARGDRWLRATRVAVATVGAAAVLWLLWVELFRLDAICLYCTGVHLVTIALFVLTGIGTAATAPDD